MNVYHHFNYKGHYIEIHSPLTTVHTISIDQKYLEPSHKITVYKSYTEAKREAKRIASELPEKI